MINVKALIAAPLPKSNSVIGVTYTSRDQKNKYVIYGVFKDQTYYATFYDDEFKYVSATSINNFSSSLMLLPKNNKHLLISNLIYNSFIDPGMVFTNEQVSIVCKEKLLNGTYLFNYVTNPSTEGFPVSMKNWTQVR